MAIFSVISLRTRIRLLLKYVESLHSIRKKKHYYVFNAAEHFNYNRIPVLRKITLKMATLWPKHVGDHNTVIVHQ